MGMFDSMYDKNGDEWQTKAFDCLLDRYQLGDALPGPPIDYQVEIFGGRSTFDLPAGRDSFAEVRGGVLHGLEVERDPSLPLMDYGGHWPRDQQPST